MVFLPFLSQVPVSSILNRIAALAERAPCGEVSTEDDSLGIGKSGDGNSATSAFFTLLDCGAGTRDSNSGGRRWNDVEYLAEK